MAAADELCWMPAAQMVGLFRRRKLSPVEVMRAVLARIERLNPALNAFVTLTAEQAIAWFVRLAWSEHPRRLFVTYDLLLTPTIACPPFAVGLDNPTEIAGRRFDDVGVLRAAAAVERVQPWAQHRPPLA